MLIQDLTLGSHLMSDGVSWSYGDVVISWPLAVISARLGDFLELGLLSSCRSLMMALSA